MSSLAAMARRRFLSASLWQALFVLSVIWSFVHGHLIRDEDRGELHVAAFDSRGTCYLLTSGTFETDKEIHEDAARLAVETLFNRNAEGLDDPKRAELLFGPVAYKQLKNELSAQERQFRDQRIDQHAKIGPIREIKTDDREAVVSVQCAIARASILDGRVVNTAQNVDAFFTIRINDDMIHNGRYAYAVTHYEVHYL